MYEPYAFTTLTTTSTNISGANSVAVDKAGIVYVANLGKSTILKVMPDGVVTTLAGLAGVSGTNNGTGSEARFREPFGVAVDGAGIVYVADSTTIRKVTSMGVVTTLAGQADKFGDTDGTGTDARFSSPRGVAVDSAGNVYVADANNAAIRKVTPDGVVTTLAGRASDASFNQPSSVAVDGAGNVYVADTLNYAVRKITPDGVVSTLAGLGGSSGRVDGMGNNALLSRFHGLAADSAGNVFVADTFNRLIRKVTPTGVVTTLAGGAGSGDGTGKVVGFTNPLGVAVDGVGNVYVADDGTIRKGNPERTPALILSTAYKFTTLAGQPVTPGTNNGSGNAARFNNPAGIAVDSFGNLFVADRQSHTIRKVTTAGEVTTLAGRAGIPGSTDGTGSDAQFNLVQGVATDRTGNLWIADTANHTIRTVTPAGDVATLAGLAGISGTNDGTGISAQFNHPSGVAVDRPGNAYVADTGNHTIRKVTPAGVVTTLAGLAGTFGGRDGTGSSARFRNPSSVAVNRLGEVYVADATAIRKVTMEGVVTTLAGSLVSSGKSDGTGVSARFSGPSGVALDAAGNAYVADQNNNVLRIVTPEGVVTTMSGALFSRPTSVAVDSAGIVYMAEIGSHTIRKGTSTPIITRSLGSGPAFNLVGPAGQLVVVEASADLLRWQPLWTNTFNGTLTFTDSPNVNTSNRYYRAITP